MKFKIGEISRLSGLSPSGIRFYEQAGVISPARGENNNYRDYSLQDLQLLLECKKYRECGFSLADSIKMINQENPQALGRQIEGQTVRIRQQIRQKEMLLDVLNGQVTALQLFQDESRACQLTKNPAYISYKLWQPGMEREHQSSFSKLVESIGRLPIVFSGLKISVEDVLHGSGELVTDWRMLIEEKYLNDINLLVGTPVEHIPSQECLVTLIRVSDDLTINSRYLEKPRECMNNNNLRPVGPAFSRRCFNIRQKKQFVRYDYLWIPVSKDL